MNRNIEKNPKVYICYCCCCCLLKTPLPLIENVSLSVWDLRPDCEDGLVRGLFTLRKDR